MEAFSIFINMDEIAVSSPIFPLETIIVLQEFLALLFWVFVSKVGLYLSDPIDILLNNFCEESRCIFDSIQKI